MKFTQVQYINKLGCTLSKGTIKSLGYSSIQQKIIYILKEKLWKEKLWKTSTANFKILSLVT